MATTPCNSQDKSAPAQSEYFEQYDSGACINWEIGRVQSSVKHLTDTGLFTGFRVLDLGCGLGDNARYIAGKAAQVVAVDLVPKAIEMATERTDLAKHTNLTFAVYDVLKEGDDNYDDALTGGTPFDFVLDSCLFHGLSDVDRLTFERKLSRLLKPNSGVYVQLAWSEKETLERPGGPRKVRQSDLERLFSSENGWRIKSISDDVIDTTPRILNGRAQAYLSIIHRI